MAEAHEDQQRTVREVNALVRALIEQETLGFPFWIGGTVTKTFQSDLGHLYFQLNDEGYAIRCMVRETVRGKLDFSPTNGMEVEVFGAVRVYEKTAGVEIEVEQIRLVQRSPVKPDDPVLKQLEQKGLWPRPRRPLPPTIHRIALVTSKQSEAREDFFSTYYGEQGKAVVQVEDVRIQGQQAAREIADTIERLNQRKSADVIVLARGGGRAADLSTFDDLMIAEAICRSDIPVVTGIGHKQNQTIADHVADYAASTPTAAAYFLAPKQSPEIVKQPQQIRWELYLAAGAFGIALLVLFVLILSRF